MGKPIEELLSDFSEEEISDALIIAQQEQIIQEQEQYYEGYKN